MKKPELFLTMDKQVKRLTQLQGLSNLMMSAGGLPNHSKSDLCACLSIVSDLTNESLSNQQLIAESVIQLSIVNDCVNGTSRS
jgi:hypothetical protein